VQQRADPATVEGPALDGIPVAVAPADDDAGAVGEHRCPDDFTGRQLADGPVTHPPHPGCLVGADSAQQ
jgi:hypothetical protein